ncbi:MAG: Response regulator of zinc sigma-54-dependent two-component system [Myxococcales bacterium]|nr:Response regulator of zinc sigma-54-dependent two-component system [Myxococcales bacterium]
MSDDGESVSTVQQHRFVPSRPNGAFVLAVTDGPDAGRTFRLDDSMPPRILIGQSAACDVRLADPQVSRRHAAIELDGERLRVTDLGSTNGTFVDDVAIIEALVDDGFRLRVGSTIIRGSCDAEPPAVELPTATSFGRMIGASREMRRLYRLCERLAASDVPVVIEGETGTGKEVLAEALHEEGARRQGPYVVFDCTAVPANLLESELFGHERGAFTGAVSPRKGVFEQAHQGTLLIDEIGDLDLSLQPKLLRALERGEIRRVGGDRPIRVDVRIVAATRRDLDREVQEGRFRDDLFHRLAVARIELPPLRARRGDVTLLAQHFWASLGGDPRALTSDLVSRWEATPWPGNVRQLRNTVARRIALGDLATVDAERSVVASSDVIDDVLQKSLPLVQARQLVVDAFEQRYLERILAEHGGSVTNAAAAAGIARRHFQRMRARVR